MIHNLRAYCMLNAIKIKWIICMQGKAHFSSTSQKPSWSSTKTAGDISVATKTLQLKILQQHSNSKG